MNGAQGCALIAYNADQVSERYNSPDTVKVQNQIFLATGRVLLSDLGRVMFSIVDDTSGHHDALAGFSDGASVREQFGDGSYLGLRNDFYRNARDNFVMALGRHAVARRGVRDREHRGRHPPRRRRPPTPRLTSPKELEPA